MPCHCSKKLPQTELTNKKVALPFETMNFLHMMKLNETLHML